MVSTVNPFNFMGTIGRKFISAIEYSFELLMLAYLSFRTAFYDNNQSLRSIFRVVSMQIYFTGWQALPLITVLSIASGGIVILQSSVQLSLVGGSDMVGKLLVAIIVREMAPILTALIVIARSGTAVASEIGTMKANREIEALESMGINHLSYITFPRILGGVLSVICLAFYFILIAIVGGFFLTKIMHDLDLGFYLSSISNAFTGADVFLFIMKNLFSGCIIFVVSTYQGLQVKRSSNEVPQVTTKAVVDSIIYVIVFNVALTALFYLQQLMELGVL